MVGLWGKEVGPGAGGWLGFFSLGVFHPPPTPAHALPRPPPPSPVVSVAGGRFDGKGKEGSRGSRLCLCFFPPLLVGVGTGRMGCVVFTCSCANVHVVWACLLCVSGLVYYAPHPWAHKCTFDSGGSSFLCIMRGSVLVWLGVSGNPVIA